MYGDFRAFTKLDCYLEQIKQKIKIKINRLGSFDVNIAGAFVLLASIHL